MHILCVYNNDETLYLYLLFIWLNLCLYFKEIQADFQPSD